MENKDENVDYKGLAILIGTSVTLALITNDIARNWVFNLWCDFLKWLGIEGLVKAKRLFWIVFQN